MTASLRHPIVSPLYDRVSYNGYVPTSTAFASSGSYEVQGGGWGRLHVGAHICIPIYDEEWLPSRLSVVDEIFVVIILE